VPDDEQTELDRAQLMLPVQERRVSTISRIRVSAVAIIDRGELTDPCAFVG
jgi:hypothetical protein